MFYSSLPGKKMNDKEYKHVLNVWNKFEVRTMKDYHDLYDYHDYQDYPFHIHKISDLT